MPFNPVTMLNFNKPRSTPSPYSGASPYPFPTTYILAGFSLLASLITATILFYFSYYLQVDSMAVPAQFIFLIITSVITILLTTYTTTTHLFRSGSISPRTSLILNSISLLLWIIGLAIITAKIGSMVLGHTCAMPMWATSTGVMVCRIYKALYSFIVVATASAGASVLLDLKVQGEQRTRGMYREMKDEAKGGAGLAEPSPGLRRGFYTNANNAEHEMKDSPDLGGVRSTEFDADTKYDGEDDTMQLVGGTSGLSDRTPKLRPLMLQGRSMSNFWRREVESPAVKKYEAMRT